MDREGAEAHLRLVAEAELRRAGDGARVTRVAQVLTRVGALDDEAAAQIVGDFVLARGARHADPASRRGLIRGSADRPPRPALAAGPRRAGGPVVPVGQPVPVRAGDASGEVYLLSYAQPASRGLLTMIARTSGPSGGRSPDEVFDFLRFSAADDQGNSYGMGLHGSGVSGPGEWILRLHPDPPRGLRWLDLTTTPGEPAARIELVPPGRPEVRVEECGTNPGEHLLNTIAMRLLAAAAAYPRHVDLQVTGLRLGLVAEGLGDIVDALRAGQALPPASPVPGQLALLCGYLEIGGHGITAPPAGILPERWRSAFALLRRGRTGRGPAGSVAAAAALPEVDGITLTILGLHDSGDRTVIFMHASGTTGGGSFELHNWPVIWIRDSGGWWHATRPGGSADQDGEVSMDVTVLPPLGRDTHWIEVLAAGPSAEARTACRTRPEPRP